MGMEAWALLPLAATATVHVPTKDISPNVFMPVLSIGTGGLEMSAAKNITTAWLQLGGKGIDTAYMYRDQSVVAEAIADSGISRKSLFITSKLPGCQHAEKYIEASLKELNTDYIDLMLIHFPSPSWNCGATWKVLEEYHKKGSLKSIGISNFKRADMEKLLKTAEVKPSVNQIQHNILEHDDDTVACAAENNIAIEAYSPLGRQGHSGNITGNPTIKKVAANHKVSTYQVAMKWILQHGHLVTFQSSKKEHQASDADVFSFNLTAAEMSSLDKLGTPASQVVV